MKNKQTGRDLTPEQLEKQDAARIKASREEANRLQAEEMARLNAAKAKEIADLNNGPP